MKLATTITTERGKPVIKTANECIRMSLSKDRINKFDIMFDGDKIEVLRYFDASIETIEYVPNGN